MPILAKQGIAVAWLPIKVTSVTPLYTQETENNVKAFFWERSISQVEVGHHLSLQDVMNVLTVFQLQI